MYKKILIYFVLFIIFMQPVSAETYKVYVDKEFGFFGVRSNNTTELISYANKTLYIDIGDTVVWENSVASDERVTVLSDNKLWNDNDAILGWRSKEFRYTFNKSGTYRVHARENQIFQAPENFTDVINTTIWFEYQIYVPTKYQKIVVGSGISNNITQNNKNKIIVKPPIRNVVNSEETTLEDTPEEIIPQMTAKIEKNVSPYEKYTLLELIKSILKRT
jgi:plastocyanin